MRTLSLLIILACSPAMAQQRTLYDPYTGKAVGRATTDSQGTTTWYGPGGNVTVRESKGVIYDAQTGRRTGTVTKPNRAP